MSSPQRSYSPLEVSERAACMCIHGGRCSTYAPGHALHLIQARLAAATPSDWADAIVESADAAGEIVLRLLTDGTSIVLWSASAAAASVSAGAPVALHGRYDVLAVGTDRFNVARF